SPVVPRGDARPATVETGHLHWTPEPAADAPAQAVDTLRLSGTPQPPARARLIALEQALQRGDAREASRLYFRAAATGAVPLGDTERMQVRLFAVALDDPTFDGPAFRTLAKSLGWDRPEFDSEAGSSVRQRVSARLAAEDWYDELVALADRKRLWSGRRQIACAPSG